MKAARSTEKLVENFEDEISKSKKKKANARKAKPESNTMKRWLIGTGVVLTAAAATWAIFRRTGELDLEDFARVRNSL